LSLSFHFVRKSLSLSLTHEGVRPSLLEIIVLLSSDKSSKLIFNSSSNVHHYTVPTFSIATLTWTTRPEFALHCWQLVGKTNVYGTVPTACNPTYTNRYILMSMPMFGNNTTSL